MRNAVRHLTQYWRVRRQNATKLGQIGHEQPDDLIGGEPTQEMPAAKIAEVTWTSHQLSKTLYVLMWTSM
jgi:hypothetical protein